MQEAPVTSSEQVRALVISALLLGFSGSSLALRSTKARFTNRPS